MHTTSHRTASVFVCALLLAPAAAYAAEPSLEGRAVLGADTFAEGPPSGAAAEPANGRTPPFASQPVQGFSAVLDGGGGSFWAMPDNGYGSKANSTDFLLRMYRIRPAFETASGGSGGVSVEEYVQLRDPDRRVPFPIQREAGERWLTGADFDIESVRRAANGDLWFGDEFGPFLLHADSTGKLLEAPIELPGVKSPDSPLLGPGGPANLPRSGGLEGMGLSTAGPCRTDVAGEVLHPMLERALVGDADSRRRFIYSFSIADGRYGEERWQYRTEQPGNSIGDLTSIDRYRLLVVERDGTQGTQAGFKRVYLVDLRETTVDGYLVKREVTDLLNIRDPAAISLPGRPGDVGLGDPFRFPFSTIEAVLPLDRERLLVLNDNNYPSSNGRNPGRPDDNEAIVVRIDPLCDATVAAGYREVVLGTAGLMSYWRLGESSGSAAVDAKGSRNGAYVGPVLGQPGALAGDPDRSAFFDGNNDYVQVPDFAPPTSLSLEAWIYPRDTATGKDRVVMDKGNAEYDLRIVAAGSLQFVSGNPAQTAVDDSFNFHTPANANRWHHVAVTFDTAADTVRFYRDGALTKTVGGFTAAIQNTAFAFRIGRHSQYNFATFNGRIDEVAIYNTALPPATIQQHYQAAVAQPLTEETVRADLDFAAQQLDAAAGMPVSAYPFYTDLAGDWVTRGASWWTSGFFPGSHWLMYDRTAGPSWRAEAERRQAGLESQKDNASTHDLGFMIFNSFGQGYRLTANDAYRQVVLRAASSLASRFSPAVGATRSWGGDASPDFTVIVDNMMNLELMFWAAKNGGDPSWYDMAVKHAATTMRDHVRPGGSTYHVVDYDPATGEVRRKRTAQGYRADSTWSRGQAWALYGFSMTFRETADVRFLETARRVADWYLANLPADLVPYWDFAAPGLPNEPRDSSAAAIAASGLLELAALEPDATRARRYREAAESTLATLSTDAYLARGVPTKAVLLHGTANRPAGQVDSGLVFGDYYFIEALLRAQPGV